MDQIEISNANDVDDSANRSENEHEPFGYPFGCPARVDKIIAPHWPHIDEVFEAQRNLFNEFCRIEETNRAAYRETVAKAHPADAAAAVDFAQARLDAILALPRNARPKEAYLAAKAELSAAKAEIRRVRRAAAATIKPQIENIEKERRNAVAAAEHASNLWWAHKEVVRERYDVSRIRVMKINKSLHPAYDKAFGALRVRWGQGLPLPKLLAGTDTLAGLKITKTTRHAVEAELTLCIKSSGRDKEYVTIPIVMSRMLPDGAVVRSIALFRRRTGDQMRWKGSIVVQQPHQELAVFHGQSGTLCIKAADLADDGYFQSAMLHVQWLQSVLDKKANDFVANNADPEALAALAVLGRDKVIYADIRRIATQSPAAFAFIETTQRMARERDHLRAKAIRHRDETYRIKAHGLVRGYTRIEAEKSSMVFTRKTFDRPAWGQFLKILAQAGRAAGCDVVFVAPESNNDQPPQ